MDEHLWAGEGLLHMEDGKGAAGCQATLAVTKLSVFRHIDAARGWAYNLCATIFYGNQVAGECGMNPSAQ